MGLTGSGILEFGVETLTEFGEQGKLQYLILIQYVVEVIQYIAKTTA